jgi:GNAT superfamily N-acetyltransferase
MLTIRRIDTTKESNAELVSKLQAEILPGDTPAAVDAGYWWVAHFDNQLAGFCSLVRTPRWLDAGYLSRAGVLPIYRRKGIQKRLIRVRERMARSLGWQWLISDTYNNPASTNNLTACGFSMYLPAEPYAGEGTLYWRKRIGKK